MNDPDNFLSRWSRRKQEAGERRDKNEDAAAKPAAESAPESEPAKVASVPGSPPVPKFDPESLPSIESISSETDITAFMRTGVPETLKRAALRRAWASDPAIRDFVGLNENFWDAAGPDGIRGFGELGPNLDVKRMVSELFGEAPRQDTSSESKTGPVADSSTAPIPSQSEAADSAPADAAPVENLSQRNENGAVQPDPVESVPEKKFARRHGGAMPQ